MIMRYMLVFFIWCLTVTVSCGSDYSESEAIKVIKEFYKLYLNELEEFPPNISKMDSIKNIYCTSNFLLDNKRNDLDYDPFLNAQDSNVDWLKTLRVEKYSESEKTFKISYYDSYSNEDVTIILGVLHENGQYKIDFVGK